MTNVLQSKKKVENSGLFYMALNSQEILSGKKWIEILKISQMLSMWKEMYYKVSRKQGKESLESRKQYDFSYF